MNDEYKKRSAEFKRWLALYFIEKGNWKLTDKAIEEFGQDATPRQTMEFAEICSDREREERTEYRVGFTAKEKKRMAHMKVADMLEQGKAEELYDRGYIINGKLSWKDKSVRVTVIRKFIEILDKDPRDLKQKDFNRNRLAGLLGAYYDGSQYKAVKEAFPENDIKPWEMKITPSNIFEEKKNRVEAVKWMVEKLRKDPRDITADDFYRNGLTGLLESYDSSQYKAVKEAFPEKDIKPWEMARTPTKFYENQENRVVAVKWLIEKLRKDPRDLTKKDFEKNKLGGLFFGYYNGSTYKIVSEAFPERDIKAWEMLITPELFFRDKKNRVAAVKWLVDKLGKDPKDIRAEDFKKNRLHGLLNENYKGSPYAAVNEAFPENDIKPWEMMQIPHGFYDKKENRVAALKRLIDKLGKDPRDLTKEDFENNELSGLLDHYNNSPYKAVKEAGLVSEADEKYMRRYGQARFQDIPSSKQALEAAKKMERNAEKKLPKRMVKGKRRLT